MYIWHTLLNASGWFPQARYAFMLKPKIIQRVSEARLQWLFSKGSQTFLIQGPSLTIQYISQTLYYRFILWTFMNQLRKKKKKSIMFIAYICTKKYLALRGTFNIRFQLICSLFIGFIVIWIQTIPILSSAGHSNTLINNFKNSIISLITTSSL